MIAAAQVLLELASHSSFALEVMVMCSLNFVFTMGKCQSGELCSLMIALVDYWAYMFDYIPVLSGIMCVWFVHKLLNSL